MGKDTRPGLSRGIEDILQFQSPLHQIFVEEIHLDYRENQETNRRQKLHKKLPTAELLQPNAFQTKIYRRNEGVYVLMAV